MNAELETRIRDFLKLENDIPKELLDYLTI